MGPGIAVIGLNGSGKSTLAHALADALGLFEMDVEDYYFPEQRRSRRELLEHKARIDTGYLRAQPFSASRTGEEVQAALLSDIKAHPGFVLSCVELRWDAELLAAIDLVFFLRTPVDVRRARMKDRDVRRFGARVLPGGDMYEQQLAFYEKAAARRGEDVEESAAALSCPVIYLDGTKPLFELADCAAAHIRRLQAARSGQEDRENREDCR